MLSPFLFKLIGHSKMRDLILNNQCPSRDLIADHIAKLAPSDSCHGEFNSLPISSVLYFSVPTPIIIIYLNHAVRRIDPGPLMTTTARYTAVQSFASQYKIEQLSIYLGYFFKTKVIHLDPLGALAYSLKQGMMDEAKTAMLQLDNHWMLLTLSDGGQWRCKSGGKYDHQHPMKAMDAKAEVMGLQWFKAFNYSVEEAALEWRGSGRFCEDDDDSNEDGAGVKGLWEGIWKKMLGFKKQSSECS